MHEKTVYAKSAKGREEIATRTHKLGFKPRALLIMVDGAITVAQLTQKAGHLGEVATFLSELRDGGFIEPVGGGEASAEQQSRTAAAPAEASSITATQFRDLSAAKVATVKFLETRLGPDAADLTVKIEESQTPEQFLAQVETCRAVLSQVAGEQAADEFWREVVEQLG